LGQLIYALISLFLAVQLVAIAGGVLSLMPFLACNTQPGGVKGGRESIFLMAARLKIMIKI